MDSIVWILGPIVVAFFGFMFWLVMGKLFSDQSKNDDPVKDAKKSIDHPDE
jgi:hypothetical protein